MAKKPTGKSGGPKKPGKPKTRSDAPGADPENSAAPVAANTAAPPPGKGHNSKSDPKLSGDEERERFIHHRGRWNDWQAKQKVLDKLGIDVKANLKADGFKVIHFQIADSLTTMKGEAKVTAEVTDRLKVARWMGHAMGQQLDIFEQPDRTPLVDRAYDAGKQASMESQPLRPPHSPETEAARAWTRGWQDHQEELAARGFKPLKGGDEPAAEAIKPADEVITSGERIPRSEYAKRLHEQSAAADAEVLGKPLTETIQ